MVPKLPNISGNGVKRLLAAGLLLVLILGFLQIPEVRSRFFPNFLWQDHIAQLQKEEGKVIDQLHRVESNLKSLQKATRPQPRQLRLIKKDIISITNSLKYMDARLAGLTREMNARLVQDPVKPRSSLLAQLQQVKNLQAGCGEYRRNLRELSRKAQYLQARVQY